MDWMLANGLDIIVQSSFIEEEDGEEIDNHEHSFYH